MNKKLELILLCFLVFLSFLPKATAVIKINSAVDLAVFPEDISFSNVSPKTGEQLTISTKIHNLGYRDVPSTEVKFYADNPDNQINGLLNAGPIPAEGFKYVIEAAGTQNFMRMEEKTDDDNLDLKVSLWNRHDRREVHLSSNGYKIKKVNFDKDNYSGSIKKPVSLKIAPSPDPNYYKTSIAYNVNAAAEGDFSFNGSDLKGSYHRNLKIYWDEPVTYVVPWPSSSQVGSGTETGIASINTLTPTQVAAASLVAPNNDTTYSLKSIEVNGAVYTDSDGDGAIEGAGILAWMEGSKLMAMRGNPGKIENKNILHVSYKGQTFTDYFYPSNRSSKILSWSYQVSSSTRNGVDDGTYIDFANNRLVIKSKLQRASSFLPSVYLANYQIHVASEGIVITPRSISVNWIPEKEGSRKIYVSVNPSKQILEFNETNNTAFKTITVRPNNPPLKPILSGPALGVISRTYTFTASSSDPEHQKIKFVFNWGDGIIHQTGYLDYSGNNVIGTLQHAWNSAGMYNIKVKAVDEGGKESGWSDSPQMSIQPLTDTKWETAIIEKGQVYNPTICTDKDNNLYVTAAKYLSSESETVVEFLKSINEGESLGLDQWPWGVVGNKPLEVEAVASPDGYKHGVFGYNYMGGSDVYRGYYWKNAIEMGSSIDFLDKHFKGTNKPGDASTWSYSCITPDIVSHHENLLAAVWIRKSDYPGGNINDDNLCAGFNFDGWNSVTGRHIWDYWQIRPLTFSIPNTGGARYANPSIAIDKDGNLFIVSFVANGKPEGNNTWVDRGWGIQFYGIPYSPGNWNTSGYPKGPLYDSLATAPVNVFDNFLENHTQGTYPRICVDKDGKIHIVFEYPLSETNLTYYVYHYKGTVKSDGSITWVSIGENGRELVDGKSQIPEASRKWYSTGITNYFDQGKWPDIAVDSVGKAHIVWVKNAEVYYISPTGEQEVISSWRGKVNSSPRIICTDNYVHVTWRESEDDGTNSVYYSRLKLSQFEISGVHCTPNPELATALLDVPDYDQNMPPFQNILPDQLRISFVVKNGFYRQHKINVEIFTDDGVTLIKRLVVDQSEYLDIDPSGGYLKQFVNYATWDGRSDIPFPDPYGKPWNGYVPPGFTWKIKITAQEIEDNGNPGKTTTNWDDWNGWNAGYRIIPKPSLSMDADGSRKGLRASYSDGTVIEGEGPINHGRGGLPSLGLDLSSYYQGFPGDWARKWDINGIFREILNGYIYAPITGEYKFKLVVDDYGALVVNGWVICTYDNPEAPGEVFGNIPLEGGKWYPIYMEYENRKGTNGLGLYWNIEVNQNFIFTDPTFIQAPRKDMKAFQEFLEGDTISGDEKKDKLK